MLMPGVGFAIWLVGLSLSGGAQSRFAFSTGR